MAGRARRGARARGDRPGERFLALEWVEPGALDAAGEEELGRGLAGLHAAGAAAFGASTGRDLHIGPLRFDARPPRTGRTSTPSGSCGR